MSYCSNNTIDDEISSHFFNQSNEEKSQPLFTWNYVLHQYWQDEADPRTKHLPLFSDGPWKMLCIMATYLLFVTVIGPYLMKNRKPFVLRELMFVYNIVMVCANLFSFYTTLGNIDYGREFLKFDFPRKDEFSARIDRIISHGGIYYATKYLDLLDTVFFVLRKKNNQITPLHLYHHTSVPILGWLGIKLAPMAPPLFMFVLLNSLVHIVMYSYYALSAFGPSIQKYLWWKRYITQLQLAQFAIFISYGCLMAVKQTGYPRIWFWIGFAQNPLFFLMFYDFYRKSYYKEKRLNKKVD